MYPFSDVFSNGSKVCAARGSRLSLTAFLAMIDACMQNAVVRQESYTRLTHDQRGFERAWCGVNKRQAAVMGFAREPVEWFEQTSATLSPILRSMPSDLQGRHLRQLGPAQTRTCMRRVSRRQYAWSS
jgi:hypothetical protein